MSERQRRFHPLLIGAASGLAFSDLMLGLNWQFVGPSGAVRLLVAGLLSGLCVAFPFTLALSRSPRTSRAAWAFLLCLALLFAAFVEGQRVLLYSFLANGSRRVLVVTFLVSCGTAIAALIAFFVRPSPRITSRFFLAVIALFALVPLTGRRAPERTSLNSPPPVPRTVTRSLLVVGLEGVSWDLLVRGASEGSLPVIARLLSEGAAGSVESPRPYDRAALWATVATGKRAAKHGVVSGSLWQTPFGELRLLPRFPWPVSLDRFPFSFRREAGPQDRHSRTFWEILAARGHEAAVLNWPDSRNEESRLSVWATEKSSETGAGARNPMTAAERADLFRVDVPKLDRPLVRALEPAGLPPADRQGARALAGAAHDLTVVGATLGALPSGPNNVSTLVLNGIVGTARRFLPSAQPGTYWGSAPKNAEVRSRALAAYYRFLDEVLGDLLEREGKNRTLCLFSPAGFGPPPRLKALSDFLRGREPEASPEASPQGFLILCGSGIRGGVRLTSAAAIDIAPTLLVLAGEPIARDMDGRVLSEAFDERFASSASIPIIKSFEPEGPQ